MGRSELTCPFLSQREKLLRLTGFLAFCPTLPHGFRDALAAFSRHLPGRFGGGGLGACLCSIAGATGPAASGLVSREQRTCLLQACYLLIYFCNDFLNLQVAS